MIEVMEWTAEEQAMDRSTTEHQANDCVTILSPDGRVVGSWKESKTASYADLAKTAGAGTTERRRPTRRNDRMSRGQLVDLQT